jgi:uncharacterized protein YeeX (DUF496 family)
MPTIEGEKKIKSNKSRAYSNMLTYLDKNMKGSGSISRIQSISEMEMVDKEQQVDRFKLRNRINSYKRQASKHSIAMNLIMPKILRAQNETHLRMIKIRRETKKSPSNTLL